MNPIGRCCQPKRKSVETAAAVTTTLILLAWRVRAPWCVFGWLLSAIAGTGLTHSPSSLCVCMCVVQMTAIASRLGWPRVMVRRHHPRRQRSRHNGAPRRERGTRPRWCMRWVSRIGVQSGRRRTHKQHFLCLMCVQCTHVRTHTKEMLGTDVALSCSSCCILMCFVPDDDVNSIETQSTTTTMTAATTTTIPTSSASTCCRSSHGGAQAPLSRCMRREDLPVGWSWSPASRPRCTQLLVSRQVEWGLLRA